MGWLHPLGQRLADLLLPGTCCLCDGEVPHYRQESVICQRCRARLDQQGEKCLRCSAAVPTGHVERSTVCPWCQHLRLPFDRVWAVANYEDNLKKAILQAKTRDGAAVAWDLGQLLAAEVRQRIEDGLEPVIVPIPMHWTRRIRRGMSTTGVLARSMSKATEWRVASSVRCRRLLKKQSELSFTARKRNVRNAFRVVRPIRPDVPILLVDDIMTTGATLAEVARILRKGGGPRKFMWPWLPVPLRTILTPRGSIQPRFYENLPQTADFRADK